jgi:hypothetical protein
VILLRNHDFGRLHNRKGIVSSLELQGAHGIGADQRREREIPDAEPHLSEKTIDAHLVDKSRQAISRAQLAQEFVDIRRHEPTAVFGLAVCDEAINLRVGDTMVPAIGPGRADGT